MLPFPTAVLLRITRQLAVTSPRTLPLAMSSPTLIAALDLAFLAEHQHAVGDDVADDAAVDARRPGN